MNDKELLNSPLKDRAIALPESRQLDILATLFERRRARVLRVPLITIHDSPDQVSILSWLQRFVSDPPDLLIALTGEGLRRLRAAASRNGMEEKFIDALRRVEILSRGPKPAKALREMQLPAPLLAAAPTTDGVIATLNEKGVSGLRVAVQLYGEDPNIKLMAYLESQRPAEVSTVAPYVYADESDARQVIDLIDSMASGQIDMIAFTSKPQLRRLLAVATNNDRLDVLRQGMSRTLVAAIGPVVRQELEKAGFSVSVMPESSFFMKPLVRAAEDAFAD